MSNVGEVIDAIGRITGGNPTPWLEGKCFELFSRLHALYPGARALYDGRKGHVVTLIDGHIYDATGLLLYPLGTEQRIVSQLRRASNITGL